MVLLEDPLGPGDLECIDASPAAEDGQRSGMPDAPWVAMDSAEWVPQSQLSPKKLRLQKKQEVMHRTVQLAVRLKFRLSL